MGIRKDMVEDVKKKSFEEKEEIADEIMGNLSENKKKMIFKKFKIQYKNHPKYEQLVKEMKRRLAL